jgi:hypothetical protein
VDLPPADADLVALALPLFVSAGPVSGTAIAMSRSTAGIHYLVDHVAVDGPPVWVHEGEVDKCFVGPLDVHSR